MQHDFTADNTYGVELTDKEADKIIVLGQEFYQNVLQIIEDAHDRIGEENNENLIHSEENNSYKSAMKELFGLTKKYSIFEYGERLTDTYLKGIKASYDADSKRAEELKAQLEEVINASEDEAECI
jgi:polyribonucleotide nucleotidyltransferase